MVTTVNGFNMFYILLYLWWFSTQVFENYISCFKYDWQLLKRRDTTIIPIFYIFTQTIFVSIGSTPICEDIGRWANEIYWVIKIETHLYLTFIYFHFLNRQMLTYGRRIPLPELDKRIDVSFYVLSVFLLRIKIGCETGIFP